MTISKNELVLRLSFCLTLKTSPHLVLVNCPKDSALLLKLLTSLDVEDRAELRFARRH